MDPIDSQCSCSTCTRFSAAYVAHLLRNKEVLGMRLATIHNVHFYLNLVKEARIAIQGDRYKAWKKAQFDAWGIPS